MRAIRGLIEVVRGRLKVERRADEALIGRAEGLGKGPVEGFIRRVS